MAVCFYLLLLAGAVIKAGANVSEHIATADMLKAEEGVKNVKHSYPDRLKECMTDTSA